MSSTQPPPIPQAVLPVIPHAPPVNARPPAILTFGILSVVIGGCGTLFNLYGIVLAALIYSSTWVPPAPPTQPAPPMLYATPYDGDLIAPEGIKRANRVTVVDEASRRLRLSDDRRQMLDRLLAEAGKKIFPDQQFRQFEAIHLKKGRDGDHFGTDTIKTAAGVVEITNATATFKDRDGETWKIDHRVTTTPGGQKRFNAIDLADALDAGHRATNSALNARQAMAAAHVMITHGPRDDRGPLLGPEVQWSSGPGKAVSLTLGGRTFAPATRGTPRSDERPYLYYLLEHGQAITDAEAPDWDLNLSIPRASVPQAPRRAELPGSRIAALGLLLAHIVAASLSITLIVAGVMLLLEHRRAFQLHALWAVAKLLVVVITIAFAAWLVLSFWPHADRRLVRDTIMSGIMFVALLCIQLAYPLAILKFLTLDSVRRFAGAGGHRTLPLTRDRAEMIGARLRSSFSGWPIRTAGFIALLLIVAHALFIGESWTRGQLATGFSHALVLVMLVPIAWTCLKFDRRSVHAIILILVTANLGLAQDVPVDYSSAVRQARSPDQEKRAEAWQVMTHTKAGVLASLVLLDDPDFLVRREAAVRIKSDWFTPESRKRDPEFQAAAKRILPKLFMVMNDPSPERGGSTPGFDLIRAIGITPDDLPLLQPMLDSSNAADRRVVLTLLAGLRGDDEQVLSVLEKYIERGDDSSQGELVQRIAKLKPQVARPALIRSMQNTKLTSQARRHAMYALAPEPDPGDRRAPRRIAADVEPLIIALTEDRDESVRKEAMESIRRYFPRNLPLFDKLIHRREPSISKDAAEILGRVPSPEVIALIEQLLRDPSPIVREHGITAVTQRYNDGGYPFTMLLPLLADPDPEVRKRATILLTQWHNGAAQLGPATIRLVRRNSHEGFHWDANAPPPDAKPVVWVTPQASPTPPVSDSSAGGTRALINRMTTLLTVMLLVVAAVLVISHVALYLLTDRRSPSPAPP